MKRYFFLLAFWLLTSSTWAQTVSSLLPARNARSVPRTAAITVTLSGPPAPTTTLRVFSSLVGGQKAGLTTISGNTVRFVPATAFQAGETLTAVLTSGGTTREVWQFTAAASGLGSFGAGTNTSITAYPFGTTLLHIAAGDLNSDGQPDIAVGEIGTNNPQLYANDGAGRMSSISSPFYASYTVQAFPPFGDVNGDGLLDLITRRNTGPAIFTAIPNPVFPSGSMYNGKLADVDGDGDLDFVYTGSSQLYVASNDGAGTFSFATPALPLPAANGLLSTGDFDGDGDVDLVCYTSLNAGALIQLVNNGQGVFAVGTTYPARAFYSPEVNSAVAVADVDADGDLDWVVPGQFRMPFAQLVAVWLNNGQGVFTESSASGINASTPSVVLGDVDGDGDLDALTGGSQPRIFLNDGTGVFTAGYVVTGVGATGGALLADMNSDGALDVVAALPGTTPGQPGTGAPGVLAIRFNGLATASRAKAKPGLEVKPNPVAQAGTLHLELPTPLRRASWQLRTALGQVVRGEKFAGQAVAISTAGLASGLYLLTVQAPGEALLTQRVVIE